MVDTGCAQLSDLFVAPDRLGKGIGRPLLTALYEGDDHGRRSPPTIRGRCPSTRGPGCRRAGCCLYLDGPSSGIEPQPGLDVEPAEPARPAELERAWTGAFRPVDHEFWATQADADPFLVSDRAGPVAAGYGRARPA